MPHHDATETLAIFQSVSSVMAAMTWNDAITVTMPDERDLNTLHEYHSYFSHTGAESQCKSDVPEFLKEHIIDMSHSELMDLINSHMSVTKSKLPLASGMGPSVSQGCVDYVTF